MSFGPVLGASVCGWAPWQAAGSEGGSVLAVPAQQVMEAWTGRVDGPWHLLFFQLD